MATTTSREERKERYKSVLRVVDLQTTEVQLPGVLPRTVVMILGGQGRYEPDGVRSSIKAALEHDDLLVWRDADGRERLTRREKEDLRRLAEYVAEELQTPDQLARINRAIEDVRDDSAD